MAYMKYSSGNAITTTEGKNSRKRGAFVNLSLSSGKIKEYTAKQTGAIEPKNVKRTQNLLAIANMPNHPKDQMAADSASKPINELRTPLFPFRRTKMPREVFKKNIIK
jgi:hypothetical protein